VPIGPRSKSSAGRGLPSSDVSLEREREREREMNALPELGHLPPEVDKRDENFIERATADGWTALCSFSDL